MVRGRLFTALTCCLAGSLLLAGCTSAPDATPSSRPGPDTSSSSPAATGTEPPPPAVPHPFGRLTCRPEHGVRFCKGNGTTERVPSFDGVPLDADVTLPAAGRGPFRLIVMLHGLGDTKAEYETTRNDGRVDNITFAAHGWAVLTYTARGFGNSCGSPASRAGTPACARGWIHLADQRYEVRDTQYLAGLLVDEGLVTPTIAVAGVSYGAGQSLELAMLKNRVRLPDGRLVPWTSPRHHVAMSVGAVYAEWGWNDLASSLVPNGALFTDADMLPSTDLVPIGVEKQSWDTLLYDATRYLGYDAPAGADPTADLRDWYAAINAGEPYSSRTAGYLRQLEQYHSPAGIPMPAGGPPPIVMQNGWTDALFPVTQALAFAERYTADHVRSPLLEIFDDVGHGWAQEKPADLAFQTAEAIGFLDDVMVSHARPPTGVIAIGTTCPATAASGPRLRAASWADLVRTGSSFRAPAGAPSQVVASSGGSPPVAAALDPGRLSPPPYCQPLPASREPGTAAYTVLRARARPLTIVGPYRVTATLQVKGDYPELVGRLWDVNPASGTRQLVEAGVLRPKVNEAAGTPVTAVATTTATFELSANLWTLSAGHALVLELVGSTSPWFRASNGTFSITVSGLRGFVATR